MPTVNETDQASAGAIVVGPATSESFWPLTTRWRAMVRVQGTDRSPEWVLQRVKAVPLSSRGERALLEAVRADDGRTVLATASEPGEHRVAAAVIAALRLAPDHPDRSLRFLAWLRQSPNDPSQLRFLRRYLPGLMVLVRLEDDVGAAIPIGRSALGLLAADLLRAAGELPAAEEVLGTLPANAPVAVARAGLRLKVGDYDGVHGLARGRPLVNDVTALLRRVDAAAREREGDFDGALADLTSVLALPGLSGPAERAILAVRSRVLRALGRDTEAGLIDADFGAAAATAQKSSRAVPSPHEATGPPLFARTLADALDDAQARVLRQPWHGPGDPALDRETIAAHTEDAVALIASGQFEAAEAQLLADLDRADAWVDAGGSVADDLFVLLAGMFNQQNLTTEEVATLERLQAAHARAGSRFPEDAAVRLGDARASLERLR